MKKILLLAAFLLSFAPAKAEFQVLDKNKVADNYSMKIVDENNCEWTYITNAAEFMKLVQECASENVGEKYIKLACDIEYPSDLNYLENPEYFIKYFRGKFDGMGCTIKNFNLTTSSSETADAAFIHELKGENSEVRNILFETPDVYCIRCTAALVVNKVTATGASVNNIHVNGGRVASVHKTTGGIVYSVKNGTTIHHCSLIGTTVYGNPSNNNTSGLICYGLNDGSTGNSCSISNCYIASMTSVDSKSFFSNPIASGSFRGDDCNITAGQLYYGDFKDITKVTAENLKSGDIVLGDGWKYTKDAMPVPEGLYYWNPNRSYTLDVGIWKSSFDHNQKGTVVPLDYGRFIDAISLKLASLIKDAFGTPVPYVINDDIPLPVGANQPIVRNPITTIAEDVFEGYLISTLKLPAGVTTIEGNAFRHHVSDGFVSNGNWRFEGNLLYLNTGDISRLITAVGDNEELTINGRYCTEILDEAFLRQENLTHLYINTWFPTNATSYPPITLLGNKVFTEECYNTKLEVYVKDGTQEQLIIGGDIEHGYKYFDGSWKMFYSENQDRPNRLFQYFPVTRNPAGMSTLMLGYPVKLPSDCRAWVATSIGDGELVLKRVKGDIVPALLPVLLSYENKGGIMHLTPYEGSAPSATSYEGSIFTGSTDPAGHKMTDSEKMTNFLTLSRPKGESTNWDKVGFYKYHPEGYILPSYVAWISVQNVPQAKLTMVFDGDYDLPDTNGINDIAEQEVGPSAPVYNLSGQRVGNNYRGLIIKNGRKYIAK